MNPELPAEEEMEKAADLAASPLISSESCLVADPTEAHQKVLSTSSPGAANLTAGPGRGARWMLVAGART